MQNIQAPTYEPGGNEAFEAFHTVPYLEGRNNYRLPDYHRLDLAVNFHKQLRRCERIWSISCYNVYNRQNPFMVYQGTATETRYGENEVIMTSRPTLEQLSIFPIMPSVSLTYRF